VYRLNDDSRVLRLENFRSTNGPNLYVYLSGDASPRNSAQLHENGAFEVGRLKGNIGNQNYALPSGVDLSKFKSVVIYCKQFHVVFGSAELAHN
jgi:Electron transfer DM13